MPHNGLPAMAEVGPVSGSVSRRGDGVAVGDAKADTERPAFGKGPLGANTVQISPVPSWLEVSSCYASGYGGTPSFLCL